MYQQRSFFCQIGFSMWKKQQKGVPELRIPLLYSARILQTNGIHIIFIQCDRLRVTCVVIFSQEKSQFSSHSHSAHADFLQNGGRVIDLDGIYGVPLHRRRRQHLDFPSRMKDARPVLKAAISFTVNCTE